MANIIIPKRYTDIKPPLGAQLDRDHPLAEGMVAGYLFHEGGGDKVYDITPNANHGTLTNMDPPTDWVAGDDGHALDFDGSNDFVSAGNIDLLDGLKEVTVISACIWGGTIDSFGGSKTLTRRQTTNTVGVFALGAGWSSSQKARFWVNDGTFFHSGDGTTNISDGKYHFLAGVYDKSNIIIYVDGLLESQDSTHPNLTLSSNSDPLTIGGYLNSGSPAEIWNGPIYFSFVYNRALSPDDIASLHHTPYQMIWVPGRIFFSISGSPATVNLAGALTPAAVITQQPQMNWDGAMAPTGLLLSQAQQLLAGGVTPSGAEINQPGKMLSGSMTPSGALAAIKILFASMVGALTPAGSLAKQAGKAVAGALTPTGALIKQAKSFLSGSLNPAGSLIKQAGKIFVGALTPAGAVTKRANKVLSGATTPGGSLSKTAQKVIGGTLAPAGALIKQASKFVVGALTPTGLLTTALVAAGAFVKALYTAKVLAEPRVVAVNEEPRTMAVEAETRIEQVEDTP